LRLPAACRRNLIRRLLYVTPMAGSMFTFVRCALHEARPGFGESTTRVAVARLIRGRR